MMRRLASVAVAASVVRWAGGAATTGAVQCPTAECTCGQDESADGAPRLDSAKLLSNDELREAVNAEMRASVERQHRRLSSMDEVTQVLQKVLWRFGSVKADKERSNTVVIYNGRLIVDERFFNATSHSAHLAFVLSVMQRKQLPNVAYRLFPAQGSVGGPGSTLGGCATAQNYGPHLLFAKPRGYCGCGTMIPNPYYGRDGNLTRWESMSRRMKAAAARRAFAQRDPRLVWRGQIRGHEGLPCGADYGNGERLKAVALTYHNPDRFDVRCIVRCTPSSQCTPGDLDLGKVSRLMRSEQNQRGGLGKRRVTDPASALMEPEDLARYKHILALPGGQTTYSADLNHYWGLGAVVFLWQSPRKEWYWPALAPGVTHVEVNASNVQSVLYELDSKPKLVEALRAGAARVHNALFTPDNLARYFRDVVVKLRETFSYGRILDSQKEVAKLLGSKKYTDCKKLRLVEVMGMKPPEADKTRISGISTTKHPIPFTLRNVNGCDLVATEDLPIHWARHSTAPLKAFFEQQRRWFDLE